MQNQRQSRFDRFLRPILASRFLTVSALIHLLIVVLFGGRLLVDRYVEPTDFQSPGITVSTEIHPAPAQAPQNTLPPAPSMNVAPPGSSPPLIELLPGRPAPADFNLQQFPGIPGPVIGPDPLDKGDLPQPDAGTPLPPALHNRVPGRGPMFGETPAAEPAVHRALQWLQARQHADGTWGSGGAYHDAFTGLALLCYLGHGDTPRHSPEFGVVVNNAINAMVAEGTGRQGCYSGSVGFDGSASAYAHGICTYALCEAYTMTRDERLRPIIEEAVDDIVKGQRPDGGWAYSYDLTPEWGPSDTSVSGWQIQALKAAHLTGIPGMDQKVHPVLAMAIKDLDRVYNPKNGSFGYRMAGDRSYTLTGVGVLSKMLWLGRPDLTVIQGCRDICSKELNYRGEDCNLYAWYYDTQACFQAQGGSWDWWNARFQNQLTLNQAADGSWPPTGGNDAGGFAKTPGGDGPLYRTTLCCLMLEVFYRYVPTDRESALSGGGVGGL